MFHPRVAGVVVPSKLQAERALARRGPIKEKRYPIPSKREAKVLINPIKGLGEEDWQRILNALKTKPPNESELWHILKSLLENFIVDESSGGDLDPGDIIRVAAIFIVLMQSPIMSAEAKPLSPSDQKKIEWIIEMSNKPEVIDILINQSEKPGQAKEDHKLADEDKNLLAWNIFHEARGEGPTGQKLVMLATVNRMFSPTKYPASAKGVILQRMQFSWANKLISQDNYLGKNLPNKNDEADYMKIRSEIEDIFSGKGLREAQKKIISDIRIDPEIISMKIPDEFKWGDVTSYHKYKMLDLKKLFDQTALSTRERIKSVEGNYKTDILNILKYRDHIFHTEKYNK
jgi:hypothetical protein